MNTREGGRSSCRQMCFQLSHVLHFIRLWLAFMLSNEARLGPVMTLHGTNLCVVGDTV